MTYRALEEATLKLGNAAAALGLAMLDMRIPRDATRAANRCDMLTAGWSSICCKEAGRNGKFDEGKREKQIATTEIDRKVRGIGASTAADQGRVFVHDPSRPRRDPIGGAGLAGFLRRVSIAPGGRRDTLTSKNILRVLRILRVQMPSLKFEGEFSLCSLGRAAGGGGGGRGPCARAR